MARAWLALLFLPLPLLACASVTLIPIQTGNYTKVYIDARLSCKGKLEIVGHFSGFPYSTSGNLNITSNTFIMRITKEGEYTAFITFVNLKSLEVKAYYDNNEIYSFTIGKCLGVRASFSRLDLLYLGYGIPEGVGELSIGILNYCNKPIRVKVFPEIEGKVLKEVIASKCIRYRDFIKKYYECVAYKCLLAYKGLECIKAKDILVREGKEFMIKRVCLKRAPSYNCYAKVCSQRASATKVVRICTMRAFKTLKTNITNYLTLKPRDSVVMNAYVEDFRGARIKVNEVENYVKPKPPNILYFSVTLDFVLFLILFLVAVAIIATL